MGQFFRSPFPILGLLCFTVAAFFSKGFHHLDEHFQILEFASWKLGFTPEGDLPWEYSAKMRSSLQPWLVILVRRALYFFGSENPFLVTFFLRLLTAFLSWSAIFLLLKTFQSEIKKSWLSEWVLPFSFIFSVSIYNGVRFSSENWGALFFVFGLCLLVSHRSSQRIIFFMTGIFLGLSFLCRFQMAMMIFGLLIWVFAIRKMGHREILVLFFGIWVSLALGVLMDHAFYGGWPLTFWNYFYQNLVQGKASSFGVQPWYEYFKLLFFYLIPPFSLLFVGGLFSFFGLYPKHPFTFCLVPFLLIHFALGHKEARFLFPVLYFLPLILGLSFQRLFEKLQNATALAHYFKSFMRFFWVINALALIVVLFHPADKDVEFFEAVYFSHKSRLLFQTVNPYSRAGGNMNYYKPPQFSLEAFSEDRDSQSQLSDVLISLPSSSPPPEGARLIYQSAPEWITLFNFNHWLERARLWNLYYKP